MVSKICHYVGSFFHYLLANTSENEEEKSVASVSAILFFILALQTGTFKLGTGCSILFFKIFWSVGLLKMMTFRQLKWYGMAFRQLKWYGYTCHFYVLNIIIFGKILRNKMEHPVFKKLMTCIDFF